MRSTRFVEASSDRACLNSLVFGLVFKITVAQESNRKFVKKSMLISVFEFSRLKRRMQSSHVASKLTLRMAIVSTLANSSNVLCIANFGFGHFSDRLVREY